MRREHALCLSILVFAGACRRAPRPPEIQAPDALWGQYIAGHTTGLVSRKSKVLVRFSIDVFDKDQAGQDARPYFNLEPGIKGPCAVSDPREIACVPEEDLKPGAYYTGTVKAARLAVLPKGVKDYQFVFQVIPRAFEVSIEGVISDAAAPRVAAVRGVLQTADAEEGEAVESLLKAEWDGAKPSFAWTHDPDGRRHAFIVGGLERAEGVRKLKLSWDGKPWDVDARGSLDVEIPALNDFKVTEVRPAQGEPQHVAVYFSDPVDPRQNLRGLVRADGKGHTLRVEGSLVKLFFDERVAGKVKVTVAPGVRNAAGFALKAGREETVAFVSQKPQVRFVGAGVILPRAEVLRVPFEGMNVRSVQVTAFQVYESNMGQYFQTNKLEGAQELGRVGRALWRKTIALPHAGADQWQRYDLDATSLLQKAGGGLVRLSLAVTRADSAYSCGEQDDAVPPPPPAPLKNDEDLTWNDGSGWDGIQGYYEYNVDWKDREDPCKDAYYLYNARQVRVARNFMASDIGLLAKGDAAGGWTVAATDLRTAEPLADAAVSFRNFQDQEIAAGRTDSDGLLRLAVPGKPFYLQAEKGGGKGYLKVSDGTALPVSHFDVGGDKVAKGVKGFIYGERGVWRPGDDIHLVFVLEDKAGAIPEGHPAALKLLNPQGQVMDAQVNARPVGGFYRFGLKTAEEAPTGTWTVEVRLGDAVFTKALKIETVVPNRLKIELETGEGPLPAGEVRGKIAARWLHGASAAGLAADVSARLSGAPARFDRFADHAFEDPAREVEGEEQTLFDGTLDGEGRASFTAAVSAEGAPGLLTARLRTRVHEESGAFSVSEESAVVSPYPRYVGLKLPKGDAVRDMLLTDQDHAVSLVTVDVEGNPVAAAKLKAALYKVEWRWWWDKEAGAVAQFAAAQNTRPIAEGPASTGKDGRGSWRFQVKYPDWGRYFVRVCDEESGHCAGKVVYIDWPGWAGRAQEQSGPGANALYFTADKPAYAAGETAVLRLPEASEGRGLVTIESGSRVLSARWISFQKGKARFELPVTAEMAPNVYVSVTLVQPQEKSNDRPIRMYGVVPLQVSDPATRLSPVVKAADEWRPRTEVDVSVSEAQGRAMTYTLAVVDEGLLGLTGFQTPDLHGFFYRKEALGVVTWDLFDEVVGAYGAQLERLLALGGDEDLGRRDKQTSERRFPPVVQVLGPFRLEKGKTASHRLALPQYVGELRVMAVAGERGAYGRAEKSVLVREPVSALVTLPRVTGPDEEIAVPVDLFVTDKAVRTVNVSISAAPPFAVEGASAAAVGFPAPGEAMTFFRLKAGRRVGAGAVTVRAQGGGHDTRSETHLAVRAANPPSTRSLTKVLEPGQELKETIQPHGLPGTNVVTLEVSSLPPLDLERRLGYLIRYPHGCVEQVTSAVFPQLYLPGLVKLEDARKAEIQGHVKTGIDRLRGFQAPGGGFLYWPGALSGGPQDLVTNYVGHFLIEAEKAGYTLPADMRAAWVKYQKDQAQAWSPSERAAAVDQAYRLYTLALAGDAALGAMNRLRESPDLPPLARWLLAAAYQAAGTGDVAEDLARGTPPEPERYAAPGLHGTPFRDQAMILEAMTRLKDPARGKDLAKVLSDRLASEAWLGTHETAYALLALSRFYGADGDQKDARFTWTAGGAAASVSAEAPVWTRVLEGFPDAGGPVSVKNAGAKRLYVTVARRGVPAAGEEAAAAEGLTLEVEYVDAKGNPLDVSRLTQGADFRARVSVKNTSGVRIDNLAVTHVIPSGWEIQSPAWEGAAAPPAPARQTVPNPWSAPRPGDRIDYRDIRDDRALTYLSLEPGAAARWEESLHATYAGRFYRPGVSVEAMYDAAKRAHTTGGWVDVSRKK